MHIRHGGGELLPGDHRGAPIARAADRHHADRPPELRHSGANQTIDQIKMYGDYALWFVDAALPEANPPAVAIRSLRTLAARAYATANGIRKGVVHINMPFRKPLEPTPVEGDVVEVPEERRRGRTAIHIPKPSPPTPKSGRRTAKLSTPCGASSQTIRTV